MIKSGSSTWMDNDGEFVTRISPFEMSADKFLQPFIKTAFQNGKQLYVGMVSLDKGKIKETDLKHWIINELGIPSCMEVYEDNADLKQLFMAENSIVCEHFSQREEGYPLDQDTTRYTVDWMTTDKDVHEKCKAHLKNKEWKQEEEGNIFTLIQSNNHLYAKALGVAAMTFVPTNYTASVADKFQNAVQELNSPSPNGRLVIIDGVPGTGKSFLVRAMISEVKNTKWIFISADLASSISGPNLLGTLLECRDMNHQSVTLLLEDADDSLNKRSVGNVSTLSTLLNVSDGLLGNIADFRVVCTTNSPIEELDEAVLRDCRLLERIEVPLLTREEAEKAFQNLTGTETELDDEQYSLANIYKLAKKGTYSKKKKQKKVGF